jgi:hypothetical protein
MRQPEHNDTREWIKSRSRIVMPACRGQGHPLFFQHTPFLPNIPFSFYLQVDNTLLHLFPTHPLSSSARIRQALDAARLAKKSGGLLWSTQRRKESQEIPPPFPPFDGCKPTQAPVTLLFRTTLVILLPIHAGG